MGFLYGLVVVVYVFICFFLILVVLVQQGKGADLAGAFGGGGTQTAFGARGATTLLHKLTTGAFIAFIVLALVLTILQARPKASVVRGAAAAPAKAAPAPAPGSPVQKAPAALDQKAPAAAPDQKAPAAAPANPAPANPAPANPAPKK
ncbi:MAG TPA: preprotein translocase subunit SecG [Thermoanaerobaculia bacterium]|nr:preprotein translocase subunit SecG [Thermoanaerobaculia bacterium]